MVWARIPPDKLVHLPLFGIDVIAEDDSLLWLHGPSGRMCVDKHAPRIWFDDLGDAHQAGATAFKVTNAQEAAALKEFLETPPPPEDTEADQTADLGQRPADGHPPED
jgi:hypothetical protein